MRLRLLTPLLLACLSARAYAQELYLAPARAGGDRLLRMVAPEPGRGVRLEGWAALYGDNNVLALSRGDDRRLPPKRHGAPGAYFAGHRQSQLKINSGAWSLSYTSEKADLYKGNRDAAQLFLDSKSGEFHPAAVGVPAASMNRSAATRWRIGYAAPWRLRTLAGNVDVGAAYLRSQRVQLGSLAGTTTGSAFTGDLVIESTRPFKRPTNRGHGFSVDAGATLRLGPRATAGLWVDNLLGYLDVGNVQVIRSTVKTNQVQTDPDGFLTNAPVLSGTVANRSAHLSLRRRLDAMAAYTSPGPTWALLYRNDYDTRLGAAAIWRLPGAGRWWLALWSRSGQWEAGAEWRGLKVHVGFAGTDPETAKQATITLGFRSMLGR